MAGMIHPFVDYKPGDPPLAIGTVVDYFGSKAVEPYIYEVVGHMEPVNVPGVPAEDFAAAFPDGVAYELWPVGVERRFGNRDRSVINARRTSMTVRKSA